jgi:hypothetical protein
MVSEVVHAGLISRRFGFDSRFPYAFVIYWYYPCLPNRRTEFDSPQRLALLVVSLKTP